MAQYIDKAALVAEIEKFSSYLDSLHEQRIVEKILSFIDALEVKEVDVEKEMQAFALLHLEPLKISDSNIGINITMSQLYRCAKHFFELGLKAQKGE